MLEYDTTSTLSFLQPAACHAGVYRCSVATLDGSVAWSAPFRLSVTEHVSDSGGKTEPETEPETSMAAIAWGLAAVAGAAVGWYSNAKWTQYRSHKERDGEWQHIAIGEGEEDE